MIDTLLTVGTTALFWWILSSAIHALIGKISDAVDRRKARRAAQQRITQEASLHRPVPNVPIQAVPSAPPPLPRRRQTEARRTPVSTSLNTNIGPRGLRPSQYPCCPVCRQRNDGGQQKIFWDSTQNRYTCTRNHKFAQNGRVIMES